jgi:lipopolysaccharide export system protein LptC
MAYAVTPDGNGAFLRSHADERDIRREIEFRRARRHSGRVRALRIALPLLAAAILSLYALPSLLKKTIDNGRGTATVRAITVEAGSLKMIEPHVKGVNERGEAYDFLADTATQAAKDADVMYLEVVRGKMIGLDGKISTLTAPNGVHDNKAEQITFNNGAFVTRDEGLSATFQTATAYMKLQMVISKTPVIVRLHESTINADNMTLWWSDQRAVFEGKVRTHIERQQEVPAAAQAIPNAQSGAPAN